MSDNCSMSFIRCFTCQTVALRCVPSRFLVPCAPLSVRRLLTNPRCDNLSILMWILMWILMHSQCILMSPLTFSPPHPMPISDPLQGIRFHGSTILVDHPLALRRPNPTRPGFVHPTARLRLLIFHQATSESHVQGSNSLHLAKNHQKLLKHVSRCIKRCWFS